MIDIASPDIDPGRDILFLQDRFECLRIGQHFTFKGSLSNGNDDPALAVLVQVPRIVHVWQIGQRCVEIDILIHVIADEVTELIQTAERDDGIEYIGMTKEEVGGMISPHADACCQKLLLGIPAVTAHEGDNFVDDVAVVILVAAGAVGGMGIPVRPALPVQAVDREDLDLARFDERGQHTDHPKIFKLMEAAGLRRKDQHRFSKIPIDFQFHVVSQAGTEPFVIFDLHTSSLLCLNIFRHADDLIQVGGTNDVTVIPKRPAEDPADRFVVTDTVPEGRQDLLLAVFVQAVVLAAGVAAEVLVSVIGIRESLAG